MIWPWHPADPEFRCTAWHAHEGHAVRCELSPGHAGEHATEVTSPKTGRRTELVRWTHDMGRLAAVDAATRWRRDHQREVDDEPASSPEG